eukprot:COSAG06_NODE_25405_length_637_cov_11.802974_1_plen_74_part_10
MTSRRGRASCIVHCKTLTRLRAQARGKANNSRPPITAAPSYHTVCSLGTKFGQFERWLNAPGNGWNALSRAHTH